MVVVDEYAELGVVRAVCDTLLSVAPAHLRELDGRLVSARLYLSNQLNARADTSDSSEFTIISVSSTSSLGESNN